MITQACCELLGLNEATVILKISQVIEVWQLAMFLIDFDQTPHSTVSGLQGEGPGDSSLTVVTKTTSYFKLSRHRDDHMTGAAAQFLFCFQHCSIINFLVLVAQPWHPTLASQEPKDRVRSVQPGSFLTSHTFQCATSIVPACPAPCPKTGNC